MEEHDVVDVDDDVGDDYLNNTDLKKSKVTILSNPDLSNIHDLYSRSITGRCVPSSVSIRSITGCLRQDRSTTCFTQLS